MIEYFEFIKNLFSKTLIVWDNPLVKAFSCWKGDAECLKPSWPLPTGSQEQPPPFPTNVIS